LKNGEAESVRGAAMGSGRSAGNFLAHDLAWARLRAMTARPTFREALRFWLKLGCISFGGPAGQIDVMHTELVERKRWLDEAAFFRALNVCMMLPGPEATQLAIWCGWRLHGVRGGIAAGTLFVLPAALLLWVLAWIYAAHGNVAWIAALFAGLKPAVVAIVAAAVIRLGRRALKTAVLWAVAVAAFVLIFFGHAPFPLIVLGAAAVGALGAQFAPGKFDGAQASGLHGNSDSRPEVCAPSVIADATSAVRPTWGRAMRVVGVGCALWFAPIVVAGLWQGWDGTLAREGIFFSQAAMVTFGGAYAVLPYVGQEAVNNFHWLTQAQMLDGLGLAETTPGPLIMVLQFVGFLGGWNHPGTLPPLVAATLGAAMTTWTTFVPCFLWIFLCAPHLECLREARVLNTALAVVTAAVVGVMLNLAVWFAGHVIFPQGLTGSAWAQPDWFALAVGVAAFVALHRFKANLIAVIAVCGVLGLAWKLGM
jgi:chromate transporter